MTEPTDAIEKKEIKTSIGKLVVIFIFIIGAVFSVVTMYNNILFEIRDIRKSVGLTEEDKKTQKLINESLMLKNQELRERIQKIEIERELEGKNK